MHHAKHATVRCHKSDGRLQRSPLRGKTGVISNNAWDTHHPLPDLLQLSLTKLLDAQLVGRFPGIQLDCFYTCAMCTDRYIYGF